MCKQMLSYHRRLVVQGHFYMTGISKPAQLEFGLDFGVRDDALTCLKGCSHYHGNWVRRKLLSRRFVHLVWRCFLKPVVAS